MRSTETLIVATLILALSLGCAGSITKDGVRIAWGDARVGADCDESGHCEDEVSGDGFTEGFVGLLSGVLSFFVPAGLQPAGAAASAAVPPHTHPVAEMRAELNHLDIPRRTDDPAIIPGLWHGTVID